MKHFILLPTLLLTTSLAAQMNTIAHRDLIITEFMADPNDQGATQGLPDAEYVEIYNRSDKSFDLENWKLDENALPQATIEPGGYFIIVEDNDFDLFSSIDRVLQVKTLSLRNSADLIKLTDPSGNTIDSVDYSSRWNDPDKTGGGYSLELIDLEKICSDQNNWANSTNAMGGTPSVINSVNAANTDTQSPSILSIEPLSGNNYQITFDEKVDGNQLSIDDFSISPVISIDSLSISGYSPTTDISLSMPFNIDLVYRIQITGLADCSGNTGNVSFNHYSYSYGFRKVVITEIMANPFPNLKIPPEEYVELFNRSTLPIDLNDWEINSSKVEDYTLLPGEYVLVSSESSAFKLPNKVKSKPLSLTNSGKELFLYDSGRNIVDWVAYDQSWYRGSPKENGGYSLEIIDLNVACSGIENWIGTISANGGTPGRENSVATNKPDLTIPFIEDIYAYKPNHIELILNETVQLSSLVESNFSVFPSIEILSIDKSAFFTHKIDIALSSNMVAGQEYTLSIDNFSDCNDNTANLNSNPFYLAQEADSLHILITEVLFNPRPGGVDFVELYNNSNHHINLNNWRLADEEDGILRQKLILKENYILRPNEYLVLTSDAETLHADYPFSKKNRFITVDMPSMPDDEGEVVLLDSFANIIDKVAYSDKFHSQLLDDLNGVSLERIAFGSPSSSIEANWFSSSQFNNYATPGYRNSQIQDLDRNRSDLDVNPHVFVPGTPGRAQFTTISLNMQGFQGQANLFVINRRGAIIKRLLSNAVLGSNTSLVWDGSDDTGAKARTGIYMIYAELFNQNGEKRVYKKEVVVANSF